MRSLGRLSFVLVLAGTRLRRRFGTVLLTALGVAAGAAALASVLGAGTVAQDQSLRRALQRLPAEQRAVRVAWFGAYSAGQDDLVDQALADVSALHPTRAMLYRQTSIDGKVFNLGAADRLSSWVRLRSGRLPHGCSPRRCEVLQVAGTGHLPDVAGLHLRRVGRADLVSRVPFLQTTAYGRTVAETSSFTSPALAPPFLLTNDVTGAASLPVFRPMRRSFGWILPLRPASVHPWTLDELASKIERTRSTLTARSDFFDLSDPLAQLDATLSANRITARRLLLVGGQAVALLLAFVVLVAASGRPEAEATRARLARFGARRWQVGLLSVAEAAGLAAAATLAGWLAGLGIVAAVAAEADAPVGGVVAHSGASAGGVGVALGLAGAAVFVLLLALHAPALRLSRFSLTTLDMAALGALAATVLAFARGDADATALSGGRGTGVMLFLLPALIAFVAAVAAVRLLGPATRILERTARRMPVSGRLAALSLARKPGYAGAAAAFLLVSVGLAVFSLDYRSTLTQGQTDQARFATPADVVLRRTGPQPRSLVDAKAMAAFRRAGDRAIPVLRLDGQAGSGATSRRVSLLGLPAAATRRPPFWRSDFASSTPGELADAVDPGRPIQLRGVRLPDDALELLVTAGVRGDPIRATLSIATKSGAFAPVDLGRIQPSERPLVHAVRVPAAARGGLLVGFAFAPIEPDVHGAIPGSGTLVLGPFATRGSTGVRPLESGLDDWLGVGGIRVRAAGTRAQLRYFLTNDVDSRFRPRQPTDGRYVPAIVSPDLASIAGPGGLLPLRAGDVSVVLRVAATARRFPSVYGDLVVADRDALATALNAKAPGSAVVDEVWLDGVSSLAARELARAIGRPPLERVRATFRDRVEARLRADPLGRAILWTLAAVAIVGLALALAGLALMLVADLGDRSELFDLEAQGAGPRALRRHVRLRSACVIALGVAGGLGLGAILSVLVVATVLVTANGSLPEPPLLLAVDWRAALLGFVVYLACTVALVSFVTQSAFRSKGAQP